MKSGSIFFLLLMAACTTALAQAVPRPSARFSFNNGIHEDEISHKKPKLVNTRFVEDRFGNANSAMFLFGDHDSYINLGSYPALKPAAGSISIWVKLETIVYSGSGIKVDPIITTRNCSCNDYNEAYAIYFNTHSRSFESVLSNDSLKQVNMQTPSKGAEELNWYHLVLTYNKDSAALYFNGNREITVGKKFDSYFEPGDSVIVGLIFNESNKRVLRGTVDDITFYDRTLDQNEVYLLYKEPNPNKTRILLMRILWIVAILAGMVGVYFIIRYRFSLKLKKEKQRLELANRQLENELRINRALMNPHFVFNAMNTLHHYILTSNVEMASDYLVKFSKLLRKILDSNMSDTISLEYEIELIELYLEIESLRFKEQFRHIILKDTGVITSATVIPIMMLQPFVENSVWHGLRDKQGDKIITITFSLYKANYLQCVIEDNGIGRKMKPGGTQEKKSLATNFVMQRLALLNKIHNLDCSLSIIDKENGQGTIVKIILPILNKLYPHEATIGDN